MLYFAGFVNDVKESCDYFSECKSGWVQIMEQAPGELVGCWCYRKFTPDEYWYNRKNQCEKYRRTCDEQTVNGNGNIYQRTCELAEQFCAEIGI